MGKEVREIEEIDAVSMAKTLITLRVGGSRTMERSFAMDVISEIQEILGCIPKIPIPRRWIGSPPAGMAFRYSETDDGQIQIWREQ